MVHWRNQERWIIGTYRESINVQTIGGQTFSDKQSLQAVTGAKYLPPAGLQILEKENARFQQQARHQAQSLKRKKQEKGVQEGCLGIGWEFAMFLLGCGESLRLVEGATTGGCRALRTTSTAHTRTHQVGLACKYRHGNTNTTTDTNTLLVAQTCTLHTASLVAILGAA